MSQFLVAAIGSGSILAIVLATDLGRRRLTTWRLVRSLLAVVIICGVFVHSLPLHGNDLPAQLAGVGLGVLCGLVAAQFLPVSRDGGEIVTRGGIAYATVWVLFSGARVLFAYGAENWFAADLVRFSMDNAISGRATYTNFFVFMTLAAVLTRSAVLLSRGRRNVAASEPEPVRC
ncbi:hypothetical protein NLM24_21645 [Nocardia zapadnayensis]|uniref:hypothetical protein n=1 Tax=Nocardia rhamnosiphila TaxID=426716 RepID=UPI002247C458|nr:hypothetical protein [Nocardia zapadnayensis]MCX0273256.1 hypothetical protein [Nocardia zapadnayensis]